VGSVVARFSSEGAATNYLAVSNDSLWIPNPGKGTLSRIDLASNELVAAIAVGEPLKTKAGRLDPTLGADPYAVVVSGDQVWVTQVAQQAVARIDPSTNEIVEQIPIGVEGYTLALDGDTLWVGAFFETKVLRVDLQAKQVSQAFDLNWPTGIAIGGDAVWVGLAGGQNEVARIDPQTNQVVARIPVGKRPEGLAFGEGAVWVANDEGMAVTRIDPATNAAKIIPVGIRTFDVAVGGGAVWAASADRSGSANSDPHTTGMLVRIDPQSNQVVGKLPVRAAYGVAYSEAAVWVVSIELSFVVRVEPEP
jgi:YVTN family beta-propeller protein